MPFRRIFPFLSVMIFAALCAFLTTAHAEHSQESDPHCESRAPLPSSRFSPGTYLGDIELVRFLGKGGMGEVWEVKRPDADGHPELTVAKVLNKGSDPLIVAQNELRMSKLAGDVADLNEKKIRAAKSLQEKATKSGNENLVFYSPLVGEEDFLQTWAKESNGETKKEGLDFLETILSWVISMSKPVSALNARGIVHCDIKPANFLRMASKDLLLIDLGFAKSKAELKSAVARAGLQSEAMSEALVPGKFGGTKGFTAPEVFQQDQAAMGDASDVFSLGKILYWMVFGTTDVTMRDLSKVKLNPLFKDTKQEWFDQFMDMLTKAIAETPTQRTQSVDELLNKAEQLLRELRVHRSFSRPIGTPQPKAPEAYVTSSPEPRKSISLITAAASPLVGFLLFLSVYETLKEKGFYDPPLQPLTKAIVQNVSKMSGNSNDTNDKYYISFLEETSGILPLVDIKYCVNQIHYADYRGAALKAALFSRLNARKNAESTAEFIQLLDLLFRLKPILGRSDDWLIMSANDLRNSPSKDKYGQMPDYKFNRSYFIARYLENYKDVLSAYEIDALLNAADNDDFKRRIQLVYGNGNSSFK